MARPAVILSKSMSGPSSKQTGQSRKEFTALSCDDPKRAHIRHGALPEEFSCLVVASASVAWRFQGPLRRALFYLGRCLLCCECSRLILRVFSFTFQTAGRGVLQPGSAGLGLSDRQPAVPFPVCRFISRPRLPARASRPRTRLRPRPLYLSTMSLRLRKKPPALSLQRRRELEISAPLRMQCNNSSWLLRPG